MIAARRGSNLRTRPVPSVPRPSDWYVAGPSHSRVSGLKSPDPTGSFKSRVISSMTRVPCAVLSVPLRAGAKPRFRPALSSHGVRGPLASPGAPPPTARGHSLKPLVWVLFMTV